MSLKIHPFPMTPSQSRDSFLLAIEEKVANILPLDAIEQIQNGQNRILLEALPIFKLDGTPASGAIRVSFLCAGEYTHGVGRYVDDALSRWLVPGKNLSICSSAKSAFSFNTLPDQGFFFGSILMHIESKQDAEIAERNINLLILEMKLNIQAVYHARHITSLKNLSFEHKNLMVQEQLKKLLEPSMQQESEQSLFDLLQGFLVKLNREEKEGQIQKTISQLTEARPKSFDRAMFSEMTYFTVLFKDQFAMKRQARHISRVIALHYLFKKILIESTKKSPTERHVSLKVYKTRINGEFPILGILFGMNMIRESEGLNRRFLLTAIKACVPDVEAVKDSFLFDRRDGRVNLFYIEIHKPSYAQFTADEVNALRERLSQEVKKQVESDVHPIFLPRNEEEVARNLILLSQQLKYRRDFPQVNIQYEKQSETAIFFTILIARLLLPNTKGVREQLLENQSNLSFSIEEIREIGKLRRKTPKETSVLRVALDKAPFFRVDYSVDLLRARQKVAYELGRIIGEYRDFNGGMILKQEESLLALRKLIGNMTQETEFLLEEYFYAIRPGIMQTALPPAVLKAHFCLLEKHRNSTDFVLREKIDNYHLLFSKSNNRDFKTKIEIAIGKLSIPSYELTNCFVQIPPMNFLGYILRSDNEESELLFKAFNQSLLNAPCH
jgi:hypothetical protein